MTDRRQQVWVIAQENLKLAAFLFHHWWRCEDIVCLLASQKRFKDDYKTPYVLPKVNKANMAGMMGDIKEYLR